MDEQELIEQWKREEHEPFSGWDFSHLEGRYSEAEPPWSYADIVRELLPHTDSVLDLGTGGGEKLLALKDALPPTTVATEGWPPNIAVAQRNLDPHGISVVPYNVDHDARMPFVDYSFGMVINRHEAYDGFEVARILKPGGVFVTQQVDGPAQGDLASMFGRAASHPHVTLAVCAEELREAGLIVERSEEAIGKLRFRDVGAFVYYAHACPWDVPADFAVERYSDQLMAMHQNGRLSFDMGHFLIQARKPL